MSAQQKVIRASTQEHLSIKDVIDGIVLLKDDTCCLVLKTTAINFGLLSEREQEATIFAYAGLLNSLTFPVQIVINSRQKDVSGYLTLIAQQLQFQKDEKLRIQIKKYKEFVETIVQKNKVLDKRFYIVIPFGSISFGKLPAKDLLEKAKTDLYPKRDHLLSQFQRLGLKARQLNSQELIELYYSIYNSSVEGQKFISAEEYSSALVSPAAKKTAPAAIPAPTIAPQNKEPLPQMVQAAPPPKKIVNQPLVGQKLQEKINNIVNNVQGGKNAGK